MHAIKGSLWFLTIIAETIHEEPYETLDELHMENHAIKHISLLVDHPCFLKDRGLHHLCLRVHLHNQDLIY